jgi:hypothetical protein
VRTFGNRVAFRAPGGETLLVVVAMTDRMPANDREVRAVQKQEADKLGILFGWVFSILAFHPLLKCCLSGLGHPIDTPLESVALIYLALNPTQVTQHLELGVNLAW